MTVYDEAKLLVCLPGIVIHENRVSKVFVVLPNIRQSNFEAASLVTLYRTVLDNPVEKIVRLAHIAAVLNYSTAVVGDQTKNSNVKL